MEETLKATRYQILVVDDEPSVCKAIKMMLKYYGHEVQTAGNGVAALALYEIGQFDLIITDYLMPEMKGDQLVTQIRQCQPRQRIIMITAFADDFNGCKKSTGGVDLVLTKPFTLEELRTGIAKVMN
jgi:CheY-like chemotaxis protein